ncbi:alcohol dehydrogenase family protein [Yoonia sp. BS5-3]|uniref:Alcohol dehydrogenase family protein n=1 Tax=Yoonia phaeophyticola TaxID=3137369 RepID=A0ABZ2V4P6_9RHOB
MRIPATMFAIVTTGNGGYDKLEAQQVPTPVPAAGEVLIRVGAAGVNNTEINTRLGWYSKTVTSSTDDTAASTSDDQKADGGWNAATPFPLIQGTDCCGTVVQGPPELLDKRVIVRACMRPDGFDTYDNIWMASDFDGAFAQYVKVPLTEVFAVNCDWTDAELATIPCAYGTAETMLERAKVSAGDRVLVTGASGGVGSAAVQLAKRRGAQVVGVASGAKADLVAGIGADQVCDRGSDLIGLLGENAVDVVIDNVGGEGFGQMLQLLRRGGRYASSGAIAGPIVALDLRDMYLKDITLFGSTAWDAPVFPNLIRYIEAGEIRPLLAKTFDLADIAQAQDAFLQKAHFGNFVLIPPA